MRGVTKVIHRTPLNSIMFCRPYRARTSYTDRFPGKTIRLTVGWADKAQIRKKLEKDLWSLRSKLLILIV